MKRKILFLNVHEQVFRLIHTIRIQAKVVQKVIRYRLRQIPTVDLQSEEHDTLRTMSIKCINFKLGKVVGNILPTSIHASPGDESLPSPLLESKLQ